MARPKKNIVILTEADIEKLQKIVRTRTAEARTVQRAKILLCSSDGMSDTATAEKLDIYDGPTCQEENLRFYREPDITNLCLGMIIRMISTVACVKGGKVSRAFSRLCTR
jgi:hypothetical protein